MVKEKIANESRTERFKRLATARTNAVLEKLRVLGNCSNASTYEYSAQEVEKIFFAIDKELKKTRAKFEANTEKRTFRL